MLCNDVEQVIEQSGLHQLSEAARTHVAQCPSCTALIEDFAAIITAATQIPAEVEPPARIWASIETQLVAEGIIRQPASSPAFPSQKTSFWHDFGRLLRGRTLATAAVAALVIVAAIVQFRPTTSREPAAIPPTQSGPFAETATTLDQEEQSLGPIQNASTLGAVSTVDTSLRENLVTVNAFIKECQKRLNEDPNDAMARDYLSTAYQQKAEILAAMMERGRSVN